MTGRRYSFIDTLKELTVRNSSFQPREATKYLRPYSVIVYAIAAVGSAHNLLVSTIISEMMQLRCINLFM